MKKLLFISFCILSFTTLAQKKSLDHTVYDAWQSVTERSISNDGKYISYVISPQEGDGRLVVQSVTGAFKKVIARGYGSVMTADSRYLICRIKPGFFETREAKIKKKKPEDMPKDSLVILELGKDSITKIPRLKNFKVPEDAGNWLAYLLDKPVASFSYGRLEPDSATRVNRMLLMADSLFHKADSIRNKANEVKEKGLSVLRKTNGPLPTILKTPEDPVEEGTELVLKNLVTGEQKSFKLVSEYFFNKKGNVLVIETTKKNKDTSIFPTVLCVDLISNVTTTIFKGFNDAKGYRMDEAGTQLAFMAERDSSTKSLQKFYKVYYHVKGADSAWLVADRYTKGLPENFTISEHANISFSKSGQRLFIGTARILPVQDTTLPAFERVSVDVWHFNDDYVQPVQLKNLDNDLKRSFVASLNLVTKKLVQLGNEKFRNILQTHEGDGAVFYTASDYGKRVATQWQGFALNDLYAVNAATGDADLIAKDFKGSLRNASYTGKYLVMFDENKQAYFVYNSITKKVSPLAKDITSSLSDEENDVPDDAYAYGIVKWIADDTYVLIYDRYDIWKVDPNGIEKSILLTHGRKDKIQYRYINTNPDEKFIKADQKILVRAFDEKDKSAGLAFLDIPTHQLTYLFKEPVVIGLSIQKAKNGDVLLYTKESVTHSPDLYVHSLQASPVQVTSINTQQHNFNWLSAELFKWKAYTGKEAAGILYKPEDFDSHKKYPMIVYFYDRSSHTLNNYLPPAPTPSRLNIPFFVSRGYLVFVPDIRYKTGHPGQGAYDHILSGTRAVVKLGFVDSTKIGLQGQSWGGYQIVYLLTKTNLYAAAWAGAPVANMTSAYGGIRWGSGLLRQMQYEKQQSRIGATLWEKPNLYIENSALFHLPKVTTPLVIMANDADDAVPWYQGIELYAGMRRLGKKVWMLNYNGEAHNLIERKNRKDIQIREQQFFDYLLKGDQPAKWISEGIPAIMKGRIRGIK